MEKDDNLEPWPGGKPPTIGQAKGGKLVREIRSMWTRIEKAGVSPPATLQLIKPEDVSGETPAKDYRDVLARCKALRFYVKGVEGAKGINPALEDDDDGGEPEPDSEPSSPAEPPAPVSADPGGNGKLVSEDQKLKPADEAEQYRAALKSFRKDAVLARAIAEAHAFEPAKMISLLDEITEIDDDGGLWLRDGEVRLALDGAAIRKLLPAEVAAPRGAGGGSGGRQPLDAKSWMPRPHLTEPALRSQAAYERLTRDERRALQKRLSEEGEG